MAGNSSLAYSKSTKPHEGKLVVEDNIQEGTVYFHSAVVVNEAQLPELIQKETDARAPSINLRSIDGLSLRTGDT
jgi:hypothetical protein